MTRQRALRTTILVVGLAGLVYALVRSLDDASEQVLPGPVSLAAGAVLALVAVIASGHAWTSLFHDELPDHETRLVLRGTCYVSQITKYLPVGGVAQAASQVSLARGVGVSLGRVALAFAVAGVGAVAAGATIGAGVVFAGWLPWWVRIGALCGLASPILLRRRPMEVVLDLARRVVRRVPQPHRLPPQRGIYAFYAWDLITMGALSAAYAGLLASITDGLNPFIVACAFSLSWVIGFLVVPIPAGVGVREAVLVGLLPDAGVAPLVAASLALRLISMGAELLAIVLNRLAQRWHRRGAATAVASADTTVTTSPGATPAPGP